MTQECLRRKCPHRVGQYVNLIHEAILRETGALMDGKSRASIAQFQSHLARGVLLADFGVRWCAPCRIQETIIETLCQRYSHRAKVMVMDLDENRRLATQFVIRSVPTLILFKNGTEVCRFIGLQSEDTLCNAIDHFLD